MRALEELGQTCCLVGGLGVRLNGKNDRPIKDLDIIVLNRNVDVSDLQDALVEHNAGLFYLVRPQTRGADFMKLYFRIPRTQHKIKVDLLVSSEHDVEIPRTLNANHFEYLNGLDVAPDYFLLYHKLLGWDCGITSDEAWKVQKANTVDYTDILFLCDVLYDEGIDPLDKSHLGRRYLINLETRAHEFCETYGRGATRRFQRIGFDF
ncbi:hypothetical protein CPB86DRAFT_781853 [Serendipita vermifera]|nr:hypothetical protein CPB86DRAFT_781853 [Serendipita vermifera]